MKNTKEVYHIKGQNYGISYLDIYKRLTHIMTSKLRLRNFSNSLNQGLSQSQNQNKIYVQSFLPLKPISSHHHHSLFIYFFNSSS